MADRMFALLPEVFRTRDQHGELERLLTALEAFFFTGHPDHGHGVTGLEPYIDAIPDLFAPLGVGREGSSGRTPDAFLHWLAAWLSFTPHRLFAPDALRRIIAGIVPLYSFRGTRQYLERLLELCFGDEVALTQVDDRPQVGFTVGESRIGIDTRLAVTRPFCFKVIVSVHDTPTEHVLEALQYRLRAVIDFAKPAHTAYDLEWRTQPQADHSGSHARRRSPE